MLLPLFASLGGAEAAPRFLGWIMALALPAGGVVSLANGLVDVEGDARVGRRGPAVRLGRAASMGWLLVLHVLIVAGAATSLALAGNGPIDAWVGLAGGAVLVVVGWTIGRAVARERRRLGWEVEALGLAVLASAWFRGMASGG